MTITEEMMPDASVEAAAREIAMAYGKNAAWQAYILDARAALAAGLNAWSNQYASRWVDNTPVLILPLSRRRP